MNEDKIQAVEILQHVIEICLKTLKHIKEIKRSIDTILEVRIPTFTGWRRVLLEYSIVESKFCMVMMEGGFTKYFTMEEYIESLSKIDAERNFSDIEFLGDILNICQALTQITNRIERYN